MLNVETRGLIARALGLLAAACIVLGEIGKGEEVLRLGVQYAGDGPMAADIYFRLGSAMLSDGRAGESIGPLRRAANLGAPRRQSLAVARAGPRITRSLHCRLRRHARGARRWRDDGAVASVISNVREVLGPAFGKFEQQNRASSLVARSLSGGAPLGSLAFEA